MLKTDSIRGQVLPNTIQSTMLLPKMEVKTMRQNANVQSICPSFQSGAVSGCTGQVLTLSTGLVTFSSFVTSANIEVLLIKVAEGVALNWIVTLFSMVPGRMLKVEDAFLRLRTRLHLMW